MYISLEDLETSYKQDRHTKLVHKLKCKSQVDSIQHIKAAQLHQFKMINTPGNN